MRFENAGARAYAHMDWCIYTLTKTLASTRGNMHIWEYIRRCRSKLWRALSPSSTFCSICENSLTSRFPSPSASCAENSASRRELQRESCVCARAREKFTSACCCVRVFVRLCVVCLCVCVCARARARACTFVRARVRIHSDARTGRKTCSNQAVPVVKEHTENTLNVTFASNSVYSVANVSLHGTSLPWFLLSVHTKPERRRGNRRHVHTHIYTSSSSSPSSSPPPPPPPPHMQTLPTATLPT